MMALSTLALPAMAQNTAGYKDAAKEWSDGPLTEADFSVRHLASTLDNVAGDLNWGIKFVPVKDKIGNLRFRHMNSVTYMDKLGSWQCPEYRQPWSMDYFQTMFDMVEINRRKMQADLNANPQDHEQIREYYSRSLRSLDETYKMETDRGNDAAAVTRYQVQAREELDAWEEAPLEEPAIRHTAVGIGMYAGYEGEAFLSPLSDVLGMRHQLQFGWVVPVKQFYTAVDFGVAFGSPVKKDAFIHDVENDYDWRKSEKYTGGNFNFRLGYRVVDQPRVALIPFAGAGGSFIEQDTGWKDMDGKTVTSTCGGLRLQGGVLLQAKYLRHLTALSYNSEYGEHSLAFRIYGARTSFKGIGPVWSVNFGVCVDVTAWPLKFNRE